MHVKKGDNVKVITGNDRGRTGEIIRVLPKQDRVVVEGVNMRKKHLKLRNEGQGGGITEMAMPIHASNVKKIKG